MRSLVVAEKCSGHAQKGQKSSAKILKGKAVSCAESLREAFQKSKCSLVQNGDKKNEEEFVTPYVTNVVKMPKCDRCHEMFQILMGNMNVITFQIAR